MISAVHISQSHLSHSTMIHRQCSDHLAAVFLNAMLSVPLFPSCSCFAISSICPAPLSLCKFLSFISFIFPSAFQSQKSHLSPPPPPVSGLSGGISELVLRADSPRSPNLPVESEEQRVSDKAAVCCFCVSPDWITFFKTSSICIHYSRINVNHLWLPHFLKACPILINRFKLLNLSCNCITFKKTNAHQCNAILQHLKIISSIE